MKRSVNRQALTSAQLELFADTRPSGANLAGNVFGSIAGRQASNSRNNSHSLAMRPFSTTAISHPVQRRCPEQYTRSQR